MFVYDRPVVVEMLIQRDVGPGTLEQLGEPLLAAFDGQSAQILAVQLEQIKSAEYRSGAGAPPPD